MRTFAKAARYKMRDTLANILWRPSSALLGRHRMLAKVSRIL